MIPVLNASGCLDALTAPEVARSLDGFVTKTITPLPREGNAPPRIAETAHGELEPQLVDANARSLAQRLASLDADRRLPLYSLPPEAASR